MRILIVGGNSTLARALIPVLAQFAEVITAGRSGCDVRIDLSNDIDARQMPRDIDVLVNAAASFGTTDAASIYQTEQTNVLGALRLCQLCSACRSATWCKSQASFPPAGRVAILYGLFPVQAPCGGNDPALPATRPAWR